MINFKNSTKAFTLIELAVVLTILSMLITVIITIVPFNEDKESKQRTQANLAKIEEAILAHYNQKGYIPCPAALNADIASSTFGVSSNCGTAGSVADEWTDVNSGVDRIRIGAVPTRELNISDSFAFDGWNNRITYVAIANLAQTDALFNLHKTTTDEIISIIDSAGNQINQTNPSQVAFILISHGRDGAGSTNYPGNTTLTCNVDNSEENCNNDAIFRDQFINVDSTTNYFDDYLRWKTKEQVMTEGDYAGTGGGTTAKYALFVNQQNGSTSLGRSSSGASLVSLNNAVVNNTDVTFTTNNIDFPAGRFIVKEGHIGCGIEKMHFYRQTAAGPVVAGTYPWVGNATYAAINDNRSCAWSIGSYDYTSTSYNTTAWLYAQSTQASYGAGRAVGGGDVDYHYYDYVEVWQQ